jgi:hypothetical protein
MNTFFKHVLAALAAALVALAVAGATAGNGASASATTFSGQATILKGTVLGRPVNVVDTGPVAAGGGELEQSFLCYPDGPSCAVGLPDMTSGAVETRVLHASVVAHGNSSRATATVAELAVNAAGVTIGAEFVSARAQAKCSGGTASVTGSVEIVDLTINGEHVDVTGEVGQRVGLPLGIGVLILNQQSPATSGGRGEIDVNAIRVVIPAANTDLIIAAAHADITCAALLECPGKHAFVTGGGFIPTKQHFAVAGRDGETWGHVMWKPTGLHVKRPYAKVFHSLLGLTVSAESGTFHLPPLEEKSFEGAAILWWTTDGTSDGPKAGQALAIDMGEPGRSDFFEVLGAEADNFPSLGAGFLDGGNIQMHGKCTGSGD